MLILLTSTHAKAYHHKSWASYWPYMSMYIAMSEVPELTSDAEMIWAKLSTPKQKPLYFCSFYRIPNIDSCPIISLNETLLKLHQMVPNPKVLLCGDFNLTGISWLEGGVIDSCPAYGYGINQVFLDTIN